MSAAGFIKPSDSPWRPPVDADPKKNEPEPPPELADPLAREIAARYAAQPLGSMRHTKRLMLAVRRDGIREARAREGSSAAAPAG